MVLAQRRRASSSRNRSPAPLEPALLHCYHKLLGEAKLHSDGSLTVNGQWNRAVTLRLGAQK